MKPNPARQKFRRVPIGRRGQVSKRHKRTTPIARIHSVAEHPPETEKPANLAGFSFRIELFLAGADGNRIHQGRDTPPTGFEDRERHQTTSCSHAGKMVERSTFIRERQPWARRIRRGRGRCLWPGRGLGRRGR